MLTLISPQLPTYPIELQPPSSQGTARYGKLCFRDNKVHLNNIDIVQYTVYILLIIDVIGKHVYLFVT